MENDVNDFINSLGNDWGEAECCRCKSVLMVEEGDQLAVAVGEDRRLIGILCGRCDRIMAQDGVPMRV